MHINDTSSVVVTSQSGESVLISNKVSHDLIPPSASELLEHHRAIIQASDDAIISKTLDAIISSWNPAAERIFGYSAAEAIGQSMLILFPPDHVAEEVGILQRISRGEKVGRLETVRRRKDGSLINIAATISPIYDIDGNVIGASNISRDITERKNAQHKLELQHRQIGELAELAHAANRAKSTFLANMSHELRTPMNAILGFTQLLALEDLNADIKDSVGHIEKAGRHLMTLINEVLDLSRIEAGKIELSNEVISIDELLTGAMDIIGSVSQRHGIKLNYLRPDVEAPAILADRNRLNQVVLNLISNAIKYNRPDGKVDVFVGLKDDRVRIHIADTGIGLSQQSQELLFTPYTRFGPSHIEGTGIGLTIAKRLVETMGGNIGVVSQENIGSTFWIEFPQVSAAKTASMATVAISAIDGVDASEVKGTLLYIEDSLANQEMVRKALRHFPGLRLLMTGDPHAGLKLAAEKQPEMILLDIMLPEIDGFEVFKHLRSNPGTRQIPVVAISANAMPDDLEKAGAAGFDEYLTKPLDIFSLREAVKRHLLPKATQIE